MTLMPGVVGLGTKIANKILNIADTVSKVAFTFKLGELRRVIVREECIVREEQRVPTFGSVLGDFANSKGAELLFN
jgi:hypothetical protein